MINESDLYDTSTKHPLRDKFHTWRAANLKCRACGHYMADDPVLWSDDPGICAGCAQDAEQDRMARKLATIQAQLRAMREARAK